MQNQIDELRNAIKGHTGYHKDIEDRLQKLEKLMIDIKKKLGIKD